jgi:hypothetical protein
VRISQQWLWRVVHSGASWDAFPRKFADMECQQSNEATPLSPAGLSCGSLCLAYPSTLIMEAVSSSKTWKQFYQITRRHIPEDSNLLLKRFTMCCEPQVTAWIPNTNEHWLRTQNYWVSGLCQSSGILNTRKHNVPETQGIGPYGTLKKSHQTTQSGYLSHLDPPYQGWGDPTRRDRCGILVFPLNSCGLGFHSQMELPQWARH